MAMQYINQIRAKARSTRQPKKTLTTPVLSKEDEAFLQKVTSHPEDEGAPGTEQEKGQVGKDPQIALMDGAQNIPLPISPPEEPAEESRGLGADDEGTKSPERKETKGKGRNRWSWIPGRGEKRKVGVPFISRL